MTITIARLTARTIATIKTVVGGVGIVTTGAAMQIGTAAVPITTLTIGTLTDPTAVTVPGGSITAPSFVGELTGNASTATLAATATILATTRTIWGQNFNGSANVSGALSGATTIVASSDIQGGSLTAAGGSVSNPLLVTTTGSSQARFRYDSSNYLQIAVGSSGIVDFTSAGFGGGRLIFNGVLEMPTGGILLKEITTVTKNTANQFGVRWDDAGTGNNFYVSVNSGGDATLGPAGSYYGRLIAVKGRLGVMTASGSISWGNASFQVAPSTTTMASVYMPAGTAPTAPNEGEGWFETTIGPRWQVGVAVHYGSWARQAAIADATGGTVQDSEARTALNDLLAKLRTINVLAT